jgi:thioesterase domain-containing protein
MIPSDVIPLQAIPLTLHGKVDRARLPVPPASETRPLPSTLCSSEQARLAAIWVDLLGAKHIGLDDNFFELGGHSLLIAVLQQRIATEFGQRISISELFHCPTVRQQAELMQRLAKGDSGLPPGVLALHPHGTRNNIFWVHHLNGNLPKAIGNDQPFFVVALTSEDILSLGEAPTLQSIAELHVRKILETQSKGPYIVGGQCAGGILAYETAYQLQTSGHEVSVLVLVDAPNLAYLESHDSLTGKVSYLSYLLKRVARLGLRTSSVYLRERLLKRFARTLGAESARTEMRVTQELIEAASRGYQPEKYEGKVLLLLASDRPPHRNFLPGWQAVVPRNLHTHYVDGHHRELEKTQNMQSVADAIVSHLISTIDGNSLSCVGDTVGSTESTVPCEAV